MNNQIIYPSKDFNPNPNSIDATALHKEENIISKYRNIPVLKTFDNVQSPVRFYENVSCVREVKSSKDEKRCIFDDRSESKAGRTSNKKRTKLDSGVHVNPILFKHRSSLSFFERMGQGSVSEPALCNAKDRGDSITLQDVCTESELLAKKYKSATYGSSKDRGIKGCIYVKSGGKLIKSIIETETLVFEDSTRCSLPGMKHGNEHLGDSPSKRNLLRLISKGRQSIKDEPDDFEIAIFLSGIRNISEKNLRKQKVFAGRKKKSESRFKQDKKMKKKKKNNDSASVFGKQFANLHESYQDASNLLTVSHYDPGKIFCSEKSTRWLPDFSSESGSEGTYAVQNKNNKPRRPKKVLGNTSAERLNTSIDNRNQSRRQCHASQKKCTTINRYKGMSASSLCQFSDEFKMPKSKIRDHVLWEKFESIFRKYASTTRHSGEVIPRKISTEWMTRAGVVNLVLTETEADEAFRQAAGVKITMNAQEYKEFLIMLTLRMKLPYYEIYRRMCGI